jgi:hypothetical protein
MDGVKFKRRLSKVNARAVSRGQNELECEFKMAADEMVSIRGKLWSTRTFQQELKGSW